ncbi:MAG: hypothetical protein J0M30_00035 [Chitinophagales bacterium]|jgi:hypothetical protein|nr:hypothetical protein [Chitinophagales bacterium]
MKAIYKKKIELSYYGLLRLLLIVFILLFTISDSYSQRSNSYSFFQLLNSGKKKKDAKRFEIVGSGNFIYKDTIFQGQLSITEKSVQLNNEKGTFEYAYSDTFLSRITIGNIHQSITLVRLKYFDNMLWRLIKDTLGIKIYDKNISYAISGNNIDYNSLIFQDSAQTYEAVTFWVTSTKRSIVKIINHLLGLELIPREFKGKEDLMNRLINNDRNVYSKL